MEVPFFHQSSKEKIPVALGADIGGTSIKYGPLSLAGVALPAFRSKKDFHQINSRVKEGLPATIEQIERLLEDKDLKGRIELKALGLAVAGHASLEGVMIKSANYGRKWRNVHVKAEIEKHFNVPTTFNNDATAAMISECSALRKTNTLYSKRDGVLFTVGTGLGGAATVEGKVFLGANGQATEFGHLPIRGEKSSVDVRNEGILCGCGKCGCAEQFTSLSYIQREVVAKLQLPENQTHALNEFDPSTAAKKVLTFAAGGDKLCRTILTDQAYNLGRVLYDVKEAFDPAWVIIGGGITDTIPEIRSLYLKSVKEGAEESCKHIKLRYALTGENAGWLGAAKSALDLFQSLSA